MSKVQLGAAHVIRTLNMCDKLRQLDNKQFDKMDWVVLGEDTIIETIPAPFLCTVRFLTRASVYSNIAFLCVVVISCF